MMSALGRNACNVLRASARNGAIQEGSKALPAVQSIRKFTVIAPLACLKWVPTGTL